MFIVLILHSVMLSSKQLNLAKPVLHTFHIMLQWNRQFSNLKDYFGTL